MTWQVIVLCALAGIGLVGFCLMVTAFLLVAKQGGWQQAMQRPIAERRWPPARRLMLAGAGLGLLFAIGIVILRWTPGGIPWLAPPVDEQRNVSSNGSELPDHVVHPPVESRSQPQAVYSDGGQPQFDFHPKLTLAWPGTPEESRRRIDAGTDRETTIYSAAVTQHQPLTSFRATVYEITEKKLQAGDPKEWLPRHLAGGSVVELSHKQIEFGPSKHLGFEITARDENLHIRRVNVLAGRRVYTVEVDSLNQERLNAEDVTKFFKSFSIND